MFRTFIITLFAYVIINPASAQVEEVDTDRPDKTESPTVVPNKWLQFEMGLNAQQTKPDEREFLIPTLLSRYGLTKKIELRLLTTIQNQSEKIIPTGTVFKTGILPVEIGTKISLWDQKKALPQTSFLLHVGIPQLSSKEFKTDNPPVSIKLAFQNDISDKFSLGYNAGVEWDGESSNTFYLYTVSAGAHLSKKLYSFLEAYGSLSKGTSPQNSVDAGFALLLNNNLQIDIAGGAGLSNDAPEWFFGIGASLRFKANKK